MEKAAEEDNNDVEMKEGDKEDEVAADSPPPLEFHRYFHEMTVEEQTALLLAPLLAKITEEIGATVEYPQYAMDGNISPKVSKKEMATIESQINAYLHHNRKKIMMDEGKKSFDVIAEEICENLMENSSEIEEICSERTLGYKVPPPPPPVEDF